MPAMATQEGKRDKTKFHQWLATAGPDLVAPDGPCFALKASAARPDGTRTARSTILGCKPLDIVGKREPSALGPDQLSLGYDDGGRQLRRCQGLEQNARFVPAADTSKDP